MLDPPAISARTNPNASSEEATSARPESHAFSSTRVPGRFSI